jgi:hypothetical protein
VLLACLCEREVREFAGGWQLPIPEYFNDHLYHFLLIHGENGTHRRKIHISVPPDSLDAREGVNG